MAFETNFSARQTRIGPLPSGRKYYFLSELLTISPQYKDPVHLSALPLWYVLVFEDHFCYIHTHFITTYTINLYNK